MATNLVSFGCSWTYGDELLDPTIESKDDSRHNNYRSEHCYSGVLAKRYGLQQENLAYPGSSLQSMQWNLMWWLNNRDDEYIKNSVILVGLTEESRTSWINPNCEKGVNDPWNRYLHSTWLTTAGPVVDDPGWYKLLKYHVAMTSCDTLSDLHYETAVRMFDGVSARYNIPVVQYNLVATSSLECETLYDLQICKTLEEEGKHDNVYAPGMHPNELGHVIIAEELEKVLDRFSI